MVLLPKDTRYLFHILYGSGEEALLFHFGKLSHSAVSCSVQFFGFRKAAFPRFISFLIVRSLRPPRRAAISFTFTLACKSISSFCRSFGLLTVFLLIHIVAGFSRWAILSLGGHLIPPILSMHYKDALKESEGCMTKSRDAYRASRMLY